MKQILFYFLAAGALVSCNHINGSGKVISEKRVTGNFTGINAGGAYEVEIKNGETTEVVVEADDNIIQSIETTVSGNELRIRTKDGDNFSNAHYKIYITAPQINSIKASGAAEIDAKDVLKSDGKINFEASGASHIKAAIDAPEVFAELSGASNATITGRTKTYTAEASGSSELNTADLLTETADVNASGASSAHVHASIKLKADASGASNIYYKGANDVEKRTSGASSIEKED